MKAVQIVSGTLSLEQSSLRTEISDRMTRITLEKRRVESGDLQTFQILNVVTFPTKNTAFVTLWIRRKSYIGLERVQCSNGSLISIEAVDNAAGGYRASHSGFWLPGAKTHQGGQPMTMAYDAASRQATIQDGPTRVPFTFDNNGNTTQENRGGVITAYTYNRRNRESVVVNPDASRETMTYDGDGLRRTKQIGSVKTTYVWDGSDYLGEIS